MSNYAAIVPSDSVALAQPVGLIWVGVTGDISVIGGPSDVATVFKAVPQGWWRLPFMVSQVLASSTTATNMIGVPKNGFQTAL